jgi:hypothetical protein
MIFTRNLIIALLLLSGAVGHAQKTTEEDYASGEKAKEKVEAKPPFRERLVFGGNLGGYFGSSAYLQINPMVGYKTNDWWVNGVGLNYIFASSGGARQNVIGASVWSRAHIFKSLILQTQFEGLKLNGINRYGELYTANVPVWLVGGGFRSRAGNGGLSALILYDLIQDPNSPYSMPVFQIGGLIGF